MSKNRIVGIGANVQDTVYILPYYPKEDTKLRAGHSMVCGGGPCATGLVAASKLGADCSYIGVMSDDEAGSFLRSDLEKYGVGTEYSVIKKGYTSFKSCIWLSGEKATRTCVYDKGDLPPLELDEKQKKAIEEAEILMVDGNELEAAVEGALAAKAGGTKVLYDAGGLYENIEKLLPLADILIPSEEFALGHTGEKTAELAAKKLYDKYSPEVVVITQGKNGGIIFDGKTTEHYPAFRVDAVDSNGSGDVFHGAFAFAVTKNWGYKKACLFSSAVSAIKCTKTGARDGAPEYNEAINFLKERGINV